MKAMRLFFDECEFGNWKFVVFFLTAPFLGVGLRTLFPTVGPMSLSSLASSALSIGLLLGLTGAPRYRYDPESGQRSLIENKTRWQIRILCFLAYVAITFIGGSIGLLVFK